MSYKPCLTCSWRKKSNGFCAKHDKYVNDNDTCPDADDYGPNYRLLENEYSDDPCCCDCEHFQDWNKKCSYSDLYTDPKGYCSHFVRK